MAFGDIRVAPTRHIVGEDGTILNISAKGKMEVVDGTVNDTDVRVDYSTVTGWEDFDNTGNDIALIPFLDLHTAIYNDSTDNPKVIIIHFDETVFFNQVGLGCAAHDGYNFSNVKIEVLGSGGVARTTADDSTNDDKFTSNNYPFGPELGNAVRISFYTADPVMITNITIQKVRAVSAILRAMKPDGTFVEIDATAGGNLKISLEEFESGISLDNNSSLRVAPMLIDEFGVVSRMLGDTVFAGAPVTVDVAHHEIHCGDSYLGKHIVDIPGNSSQDYLIIVPNETGVERYHTLIDIVTEAEAEFELFEEPTITSNGTAIPFHNRERDSANTTALTFYHTPTTTDDGTSIDGGHWGSGRGSGGAGRSDEWVLANNTAYLLRVTNATTTPNHATVKINHYVHPGV